MLNKFIFSIFLMAILSLGNPLRAMKDPEKGKTPSLQVNGSTRAVKGKIIDSLKLIAARTVHSFIIGGVDLRTSDGLRFKDLPEELREYCKAQLRCYFENWSWNNTTRENSCKHGELIHKLYENQNRDLGLILCVFDGRNFSNQEGDESEDMALEYINAFLQILIDHYDSENVNSSGQELSCRDKLMALISDQEGIIHEFYELLGRNNLLPSLDHRIEIRYGSYNSFFHELIKRDDIKLFNYVMNSERTKIYNWKELFEVDNPENNILHWAIVKGSKDMIAAILELMRDQALLALCMNKQNKEGKTALDYAKDYLSRLDEYLLEWSNNQFGHEYFAEKKQSVLGCIELLEVAANSNIV